MGPILPSLMADTPTSQVTLNFPQFSGLKPLLRALTLYPGFFQTFSVLSYMLIHNYQYSIVRILNNTRVNEKLWLLVDMKNYSDAKFANGCSTQVNLTNPG